MLRPCPVERADPILKERLFGLSNPEGNHGEDVKELYTTSMPHQPRVTSKPSTSTPFGVPLRGTGPCQRPTGLSRPRVRGDRYRRLSHDAYADVTAEYSKATPTNLLIRLTVTNRDARPAVVHILPTLWFRNTWSWGGGYEAEWGTPTLTRVGNAVLADHATLGCYRLDADGEPEWLFTENETNVARLFDTPNSSRFVKDAVP